MTQIGKTGVSEKQHLKKVYYTGSDTLKAGYLVCYDRDYGTAANVDLARASYVEKPSATNLKWFAGVVSSKSDGKTGPCDIEIVEPTGAMAKVFTDQNCTLGTTLLTLQAGSYYAGGVGEGPIIGIAYQTVDRSSTAGPVEAQLFGGGVDALAAPLGYIPDPGDGKDIDTSLSGTCALVTAGSETRGLPDPSYPGQIIALYFKTDGGNCVVTADNAVNQAGNTQITFDDAGDYIALIGIEVGSNLRWRVLQSDGVTLATP